MYIYNIHRTIDFKGQFACKIDSILIQTIYSWKKLVENQCNIHARKIYSLAMSIKSWIYFDIITPTPPVQCCQYLIVT